ncbi:MAG: recombinase family protein [Oscillospiraceae bacterium]|nr:recombinase family protein [Oscillospiraceae bacterium]
MRFAIYSRKSKFTGKGESIDNQIEMCTDYIKKHFQDVEEADISIYEDEGFSAKDMNRPRFIQMMKDNADRKFDYIVVYRLDRISRNVSDFSTLIEELNVKDISFICIKEQFDTSNPMGRAMMYIASVFAQLERETIAERVRDNMHMLARTGRWLGGTTPTGYDSVKDEVICLGDMGDKVRTSYRLEVNKEEFPTVQAIFNKFLEFESLNKLETYLLNSGITSKKGKKFTSATIRQILGNPVYCIADKESYHYFLSNGSDLCCDDSEADGKSAFIVYNKTQGDKQRNKNPMDKWIVTIGKHKGIVSGKQWVEIQEILQTNARKGFRKVYNSTALLSGVIKCKCGAYMRPKYHRRTADGKISSLETRSFSYMCENKERSKKQLCGCENLNGLLIDEKIFGLLLNYDVPKSAVNAQLEELRKKINDINTVFSENCSAINKRITEKETSIQKLINALSKGVDDETHKRINIEISQLSSQIKELTVELNLMERNASEGGLASAGTAVFEIEKGLRYLKENAGELSVINKRNFIKRCIERIEWDGEEAHIFLMGAV